MNRDIKGVLYFTSVSIGVLLFTSAINFEFFHSVTDLATVFLGLMFFIIPFYSSEYNKSSNLLFIGVAYLFITIIDLLHMINSGEFNSLVYDINISAQLWVGARFTEGFVLYFAYSNILSKKKLNLKILLASFGFTTLLIFAMILISDHLPLLYSEETGYTLYKQILSILIIGLFILASITINKNESRIFNRRVLLFAISFKIFAEFLVVFDTGENNVFLIFIYLSKFISYILLFLVFTRDLLQRPYENIFRAFKEKEIALTDLSTRDSLTGLYNHSKFYEIIKDAIVKSQDHNVEFYLMMVDIDDFKCINDEFGHVKGDEILREIAKMFLSCEQPKTIAGRYGGDEFILLFNSCDNFRAEKIASRIFERMKIVSSKVGIHVTLSIGISKCKEGFNAKDLVKAADSQLYKAKTTGKNTYSISTTNE